MIIIENKKLSDTIEKYILRNSKGFEVHILNLGAIITKIMKKNKNNDLVNVVLGYEDYTKYYNDSSYAGAIIGPTSGRIENGKYSIDGKEYQLLINNGNNANHGGKYGLTHMLFDGKIIENGIELTYFWKHLKGNHHGNINFKIIYQITENDELIVKLNAISDRNSYINLTNHSYFNLSGNLKISGDEQIIKINSEKYCPVNENMIPTGEKKDVNNSIFDLRNFTKIKDNILKSDSQFKITRAYDHAFILKDNKNPAVTLFSEYSGIKLEIYTTQKCIVMYSGNYLEDTLVFDGEYEKNKNYLGIALEAQNYQNGINIENFDYKITNEENPYYEEIIYKFTN